MKLAKEVFKIFCLSFILFVMAGCTIATKVEVYELFPVDNTHVALKTSDIKATLYLDATEKRKIYFPLIYQKAIEREPYRLAITLSGNIDNIEIIQANTHINLEKEKKVFPLSKEDFEYSPLSDGMPYFYLKTDTYLDYPWEEIKEIEFIFEFYGIKDGVKTKYQARKIFKPEYKSFITNDTISI